MSKFKNEEVTKKVGNVVYIKEGVRKMLCTNDYLDKDDNRETKLNDVLSCLDKYNKKGVI